MKTTALQLIRFPLALIAAGVVLCGRLPPAAWAQANCVAAPSGLVSWWRGESNALDTVGGSAGQLVNGATFGSGKVGTAFLFNGVNSKVELGDPENLRFTNSFSIECWIYVSAPPAPASLAGLILFRGDTRYCLDPYYFAVLPSGGLRFHIEDEIGTAPCGVNLDTAPIAMQQWKHVAAVFDSSSGSMKVYVDGQITGQSNTTARPFLNLTGGGVAIGNHSAGFDTQPFNGFIDELAVYTRALTAAEIQSIYAAGSAGKCASPACAPVPTGLISWWPGEGDARDAVDANLGVLSNGVTFAQGMVGRAFQFNGTNAYVRIPRAPNLDPGNQVTVEFWMKADADNPMNTYQGLVTSDFYGISIANGYSFRMGVDFFLSTDNGGSISVSSYPDTADANGGGAPVSPGVWHHVAGTYDGTKLQLYLDGQPSGNPYYHTGAISPMRTNSFVSIGSENGRSVCPTCPGQRYFKGLIDEPTIYNRALSAAEILGIYNAGSAGKCVPAPTLACASLPSGAISWWPGQGDARDTLDSNSGALSNGVTFADGIVSQAFRFDGSNAYVKIPRAQNLDPGNQVTVECWMKADPDNAMNTYQGLVTSDFYGISIANGYSSRVGVDFFISTDGGASISPNSYPDTATYNGGGAPVSPGIWHHVAGTYDGTKLQLYIDGQSWGTPLNHSGAISPMRADSFVSIGSENGRSVCPTCPGQRYFKGLIDEPTIYNRALSAAEILAIYDAGSAGKCAAGPPRIVSQPLDQTGPVGGTANFSAQANGGAPLSYQWLFEGAMLPGQTRTDLSLANLQFTNAGTYSLLVTNQFGWALSSNALLTVTPLCAPPPAGLVGWWSGENNAGDRAGTNNGTLLNGATFASGIVGTAFKFDGAAAAVQVPSSPALSFGSNSPMTVELWAYRTGTAPIMHFIGKRVGCGEFDYELAFNMLTGQGLLFGGANGIERFSSGLGMPMNMWTHLAATADGSNLCLYVNGVLAKCITGQLGPENAAPLVIGGAGTCEAFAGLIDEVSLYRRALSAGEIAAIYAIGSAGKCINHPPVAANFNAATVQNTPIDIAIDKLLALGLDADNDPLTMSGTSPGSVSGGIVALASGAITYTPPANYIGLDSFTYTISDGRGGNGAGTVMVQVRSPNLVSGNLLPPKLVSGIGTQVSFAGIPGYTYTVQRAESLIGPWTTLATVTVLADGIGTFTDTNPPPDGAFYRTVYP